jgi:apolipoprotein N-acyltransferase
MYKYTVHRSHLLPKISVGMLLNLTQSLLLAMLSGSILALGFLNHDFFYCAWFGLVPLLLAVENKSLVHSYFIGLVAGLTLFVTGAYWILDFIDISKDYGVQTGFFLAGIYWLYSAHSLALAILIFKWLSQHTKITSLILLPVVFVFISSTFPMLFPMRLADTQVNFNIALQGIEFAGASGLDAIIILSNIIIYRMLGFVFSSYAKTQHTPMYHLLCAIIIVVIWFYYGFIAQSYWQTAIKKWDTFKVGLIQMNETPKLGDRVQYPGYSMAYPPEMDMTERLNSAGAELIIWPEAQSKGYLDDPSVQLAYQQSLSRLNSHLLFQDMQHISDPITGDRLHQYNSAILINNEGQQVDRYEKMKRIPFGEYIPFLKSDSPVSLWVESLFGEFTSGLSQGQVHKTFNHPKVNLIPLICYETTFPEFVATAVNKTSAKRHINTGTMLIGLSNDGWFGSSHLPYQHIMPSVLRAIENRLPLVHVANNGPSIVVTPDGNVIFTSDFQKAAGYVVDVPYSNTTQGSFYSQHPSLFTNTIIILFAFILMLSFKSVYNIKRRE